MTDTEELIAIRKKFPYGVEQGALPGLVEFLIEQNKFLRQKLKDIRSITNNPFIID